MTRLQIFLKRREIMNILAIESSCDETAVAIVRDGREVLCDCIASQVALHREYGGVVPEIASRKHIEAIYGLADAALEKTGLTRGDIDAVAVTYAPGLIGAVLVGVNFAKAAAMAMGKPLIPVHHIRGHIAANYIAYPDLKPPFLCLVVSGGHTMIIEVKDYTDMRILGTTLDDAAGECFDKVGRVLGMPYPGGAALDKAAQQGDDQKYDLPRSKPGENPYNMSFSGLKTAALNLIHHAEQVGEELDIPSLCASFTAAVSDTLVPRVERAIRETGCDKVAVAGGVAANSRIRADILAAAEKLGATVYLPPLSLCGDNAAMIGAQAYYEYLSGNVADMSLNAYATKSILGEQV
jgi:N6-L-threonylcarbamoyladenine synthase